VSLVSIATPRIANAFFFLPSSTLHHLFAITFRILSQLVDVSWKQLITKAGIACITALRKVSLPALDNSQSVQSFRHFQILSSKKLKVVVGDLLIEVGIPK
jgi:hypothetical protein